MEKIALTFYDDWHERLKISLEDDQNVFEYFYPDEVPWDDAFFATMKQWFIDHGVTMVKCDDISSDPITVDELIAWYKTSEE